MSFKIGDVVIDLFGVECRIIEVNGDRYKVEFLDDVTNEYVSYDGSWWSDFQLSKVKK